MKPQVETLESRNVPAIWLDGNHVVHAVMPKGGNSILAVNDNKDVVVIAGNEAARFRMSDVDAIVMVGTKGHDTLCNTSGVKGLYLGAGGHDTYVGDKHDYFLDDGADDIVLRMVIPDPVMNDDGSFS